MDKTVKTFDELQDELNKIFQRPNKVDARIQVQQSSPETTEVQSLEEEDTPEVVQKPPSPHPVDHVIHKKHMFKVRQQQSSPETTDARVPEEVVQKPPLVDHEVIHRRYMFESAMFRVRQQQQRALFEFQQEEVRRKLKYQDFIIKNLSNISTL